MRDALAMADRQTWSGRVAEWRASVETAARWSAGRGFAPGTLLWWSCRLGADGEAATARRDAVTLARVVVERGSQAGFAAARRPRGPIVVELGDARVHVPCGSDARSIAAVIAAVAEHVGGGR